jgi:hypothetical protein
MNRNTMSTGMQSNPYIKHLESVATTDAEASMNATLAVAYEQRTANLIALWQTGDITADGGTYGITGEKRMAVYYELAQRLGFDKESK